VSAQELSRQQLDQLRRLLLQRRDELQGQLARVSEQSKPVQLDQQSVGRLSRMDAMQQQQMAQASQVHMRAHLSRVLLALQAMAEGEFGDCRSCGEPIGYGRLTVRPDSPLCVGCQQLNEN
jgi:DnaK suppressor protein